MRLTIVAIGEERVEYKTDKQSIGGGEFVIVNTKSGHYAIEARNSAGGAFPAICLDKFTSLKDAKFALGLYLQQNAGKIAKEQFKRDYVAKRKAEWQEQK